MMKMKKNLLITFLLLPMLTMAQDYEPFIVEGKVWYYEHVDYLRSCIGGTCIGGTGNLIHIYIKQGNECQKRS